MAGVKRFTTLRTRFSLSCRNSHEFQETADAENQNPIWSTSKGQSSPPTSNVLPRLSGREKICLVRPAAVGAKPALTPLPLTVTTRLHVVQQKRPWRRGKNEEANAAFKDSALGFRSSILFPPEVLTLFPSTHN